MDKKDIQKKLLFALAEFRIPKWGASHTEEINLFKRFPTHMRGTKEVKKALEELYQLEFINKYMKQANYEFAAPENQRFSEDW